VYFIVFDDNWASKPVCLCVIFEVDEYQTESVLLLYLIAFRSLLLPGRGKFTCSWLHQDHWPSLKAEVLCVYIVYYRCLYFRVVYPVSSICIIVCRQGYVNICCYLYLKSWLIIYPRSNLALLSHTLIFFSYYLKPCSLTIC